MEEFDGDHAVERRHGDGHPHYSHLTSVLWGVRKGFQARWKPGRSSGAEEPIRNMADARRQTIKAVYEDPRTGFGQHSADAAATLDIRQIYSATARAQRVANSRLYKETRALATQRFEACAGRQFLRSQQLAVATLPRAPAAGGDNFAASKRRRIVQAKAEKRLPRESCDCAGLSPKLHCATVSRAWASQAVVARGAVLLGEGPTAVTTLSERSVLVEARLQRCQR